MSSKQADTADAENSIDTEYQNRVAKRARWEDFSFALGAPGHIKVRNHSHADPENHSYVVAVDGDGTSYCTCPADTHRSEKCKHRVACESQTAVMRAASATENEVRSARGMD